MLLPAMMTNTKIQHFSVFRFLISSFIFFAVIFLLKKGIAIPYNAKAAERVKCFARSKNFYVECLADSKKIYFCPVFRLSHYAVTAYKEEARD